MSNSPQWSPEPPVCSGAHVAYSPRLGCGRVIDVTIENGGVNIRRERDYLFVTENEPIWWLKIELPTPEVSFEKVR